MNFKAYGDDILGVSLSPRHQERLVEFAKNGGFEAEYNKRLEAEQKESKKLDLQISSLELAVRAAQEAELNAEKAERRAITAEKTSIAAIVIAALVFLFELYKFFFESKQ